MAKKISISGIIGWDVLALDIKKDFKSFKETDEVDIEINSPGGSVFEGIEISNAIKSHKGKTNVVITGFAASMGSYIAMAGDSIKAHEDATFMIHNASTIEWGDHRALRKTANVIESLTGLLSKAYTKQTGTSNSEIRDLMNDETWLFGDEILNAGFVDEIIQTEKPEAKEDAVAFQKLVFHDCIEKVKSGEKAKQDLESVAAYFKNQAPEKIESQTPEKPDQLKNIVKEENMTLAEYLAANPTAQLEIDAIVKTAKTEQKTELTAHVAKVGAIIMSADYGTAIKNAGMKVLSGEKDYSAFEDLVALSDEMNEKTKSDITKEDQPDATASGDSPTDQISEEEKAKAKMKAGAEQTAREIGV